MQLPPEITATREAHNARYQEMQQHHTRLAADLVALHALIYNPDLDDSHQATVIDLGYADCLVPPPTLGPCRCRDGMPPCASIG